MKIELSWPDPKLSPNARCHWAILSRVKKKYRLDSWVRTLEQVGQLGFLGVPDGPLILEMTFYRPTRRSYDRDNLLARCKAGLDGMCDALRIDDKRFATVVVKVAEEIGGYVEVKISEETK